MHENYRAMYLALHTRSKWFQGTTIGRYRAQVRDLIRETGSHTILDYGCGRGIQYTQNKLHEFWGVQMPHCYDVGVNAFCVHPKGEVFDGVICCDVMEHIHRRDVPAILADIFALSSRFVFFVIGLLPCSAEKMLPDGRNVHLTVMPREWWEARLQKAAKGKYYQVEFDERVKRGGLK